ncbi:MAG: Unknown protein [uncultured Sulfurovum sp.]|uniref:Uncharacterized protein n=1 Tax=uncultured Sulfurovum sp. TaxID=269237 RepID=A0A6S6S7S6_9BACT|nr:MAG: Unknown protein [uncultured Sulfurovum sp.]
MKKMFLLFSHTLTATQKEDISNNLKVKKTYTLPKNLQKLWSQVPVEKDLLFGDYLLDIEKCLLENLSSGDYVLIQGEFGASYHMINFSKTHGFIPVYSVSKRIVRELTEDGIVKKYSEFVHEFFREYT